MKSQVEKENRAGLGAAVLIPILAGIVAVGLCVGLYLREAGQTEKTIREREISRMGLFEQILRRDFKETIDNLRVLADGDALHAFLTSGQQSDLARVIRRAVFFSRQQTNFDQVRYLDEHGQELVRVNQGGTIVSGDHLVNNADRPYFQRANSLQAGEIYISAFDLNVEHGQAEEPFKPVIRFAAPIFDETGRRRGVYIINYNGANLLSGVQRLVPALFQHRFRMLNSQGFWIKASAPDREWGFMFPDRASQTLARTDAALWSQVTNAPEGQLNHDGGLFTWHYFSPRDAVGDSQTKIIAGDEFLVLASEIVSPEWNGLFEGMRESFLIIGCVLIALLVASGRFFVLNQRNAFEAQAANRQLREANQELEAFSYSVSHDLRAPLRHIDGFVDRLGKTPALATDEKSKRYLKIVSESARHMGNLIDDLLVFSRMGRAEMRDAKVDLDHLVKDVIVAMAEETKQRTIAFKDSNLPEVRGDPAMLRQVFANLIGNAVKYTRPREQAEITISCSETPSEFIVSVRDNGVGFDMEYSQKLFGVFQRLHRSDEFEGTGIGLANVRRIIHRHGGRTWAESKLNEGATFYFSLPKKKETNEPSETHPPR